MKTFKYFIFCIHLLLYHNVAALDIQHLYLNLEVNWLKQRVEGFAEITLSPSNDSKTIVLDAAYLSIKRVSINNKTLLFNYDSSSTSQNLSITLDEIDLTKKPITIHIDYHSNYVNEADPYAIWGSFGKGLRFFKPSSTCPNKHQQLWSSGEPDHNKYWFPSHEDLADIHTTEIRIKVQKPFSAVCSGNLESIIETLDGQNIYYYKSDMQVPSYLVFIAVGEYADIQQKAGNIILHNYGYKHEQAAVAATTKIQPQMLQFLEQKTGSKFPFKSYTQVVVQDYPFPGLHGQHQNTLISDNYIDDEGVHEDFKYLWDGIAMQSLAAQWFGNLIIPKSWNHLWLNSAFTNYFAGLFTEYENGKDEYLSYYLPFEKNNVLADWESKNVHPIVNSDQNYMADNYSKYRGSMVLRMLQKEIGEENWWKAIQLYVKTNAYHQVETKDFQQAIDSATGKSYQWFFEQWIYKVGLPNFEITYQYSEQLNQLNIILIQIESNDTVYPNQVKYFKGHMDIEIDGKKESIWIEATKENKYTLNLYKKPLYIHFNSEGTWLAKIKTNTSAQAYLNQLIVSKDIVAKQASLDAIALSFKDSLSSLKFDTTVIEIIKNEIGKKQYWRYQAYALGTLKKILPLPYSPSNVLFLKEIINNSSSWLKTAAIAMLGNTQDATHFPIYLSALNDKSDRVINAAAIAIGKTKSKEALKILLDLEHHPSWKNQSRISALNGLAELKDTNAVPYVLNCLKDIKSERWYLATPMWDYPFTAAYTLVALNKAHLGYNVLFDRLKLAIEDKDINDIFQHIQLLNILSVDSTKGAYLLLKEKFKNEPVIIDAVVNYENEYLSQQK